MITDIDIKKLKGIFTTKEDLQKSTDQLVDLINGGFNRFDKMMSKLVDHDGIIEDHEGRIDRLELKTVNQ